MAPTKQSTGFRPNTFDAYLIISQIVAFQSLNYACLTLLLVITDLMTEASHLSLAPIFDYKTIAFDANNPYLYCLLFIIQSALSTFILVYIVERAKLCLDFVLTYHGFHLFFVTVYNRSLPTSLMWWGLTLFLILFTTLASEYLCMHYELKPITLTGNTNYMKLDVQNENERLSKPATRGSDEFED